MVDKVDEANLDSQVLLYSNDEIYVGKPVLENVKVKLEIVEKEEKGVYNLSENKLQDKLNLLDIMRPQVC